MKSLRQEESVSSVTCRQGLFDAVETSKMKIITICERGLAHPPGRLLPESMSASYGGDLVFSKAQDGRPVIIGNFVQTLDGIVSLKIPGQSGGGPISGFNEEDRFIMALLRACADAVIVGRGTLHEDLGHVWIPGFIYPSLEHRFIDLRHDLGKSSTNPLNVIVSGSGQVNLAGKAFSTKDLKSLLLTSRQGEERLKRAYGTRLTQITEVRVLPGDNELDPADIAALLYTEYGVHVVLHEGGAKFFGAFLRKRLVDELFLTVAPQIVGSGKMGDRPHFSDKVSFGTDDALRGRVLTVKMPQSGSHLYLRYRF